MEIFFNDLYEYFSAPVLPFTLPEISPGSGGNLPEIAKIHLEEA
jgi:hypothetical protein